MPTITYDNQTFTSLTAAITYLRGITCATTRFHAQESIARQAYTSLFRQADDFEAFIAYVESDSAAFSSVLSSRAAFEACFAAELACARAHRRARDRRDESRRTIAAAWTHEPRALGWFEGLPRDVSGSKSFLDAFRALSRRFHVWDEVVRRVNAAVVRRIECRRRGNRLRRMVTTSDLVVAKEGKFQGGVLDVQMEVGEAWMREKGFQRGVYGVLEPMLEGGEGDVVEMVEEGAGEVMDVDVKPHQGEAGTEVPPITAQLDPNSTDDLIDPRLLYGSQPIADVTSEASATTATPKIEDESDTELFASSASNATSADDLDSSYSAPPSPASSTISLVRARCGCSKDVSPSWQDAVGKPSQHLPEKRRLALLEQMVGYKAVCCRHLRQQGAQLGLLTTGLAAPELLSRLREVHRRRGQLRALQADALTFGWFRRGRRPPHPDDALGLYRLPHRAQAPFAPDQAHILRNVLGVLDMSPDDEGKIRDTFAETGTVTLPLHAWWFDHDVLTTLIDDEFALYAHHTGRRGTRATGGGYSRARGMLHGLLQQLAHQDPVAWMATAALRPDAAWRLVAYPAPARHTERADGARAQYARVDVDLEDAAHWGAGASAVFGTVSLDDETGADCTEVLAGMHGQYPAWLRDLEGDASERDAAGALLRGMQSRHLAPGAEAKYHSTWRKVPCRRGDTRLTRGVLPHRSGTATTRRRALAPCYLALGDDDHCTLEIPRAGTWRDVSDAHVGLVGAPGTFALGLRGPAAGARGGEAQAPARFPAALALDGLGGLSDALVCRKRWDDALVRQERDLLLGGGPDEVREYVAAWRENALLVVAQRAAQAEELEREAFGAASYFAGLDDWEEGEGEGEGDGGAVKVEVDGEVFSPPT
ncbi:hypothetical protein F4780DRAFT_798228 [Xylariomycetidae sp. FL0641]|nr:hypothetical protein F4780DRAFT_798228 [Xylariomycetidae sp. FL0641]